MFNRRYKAGRRGTWRAKAPVKLGDLRYPVAFIAALKEPIADQAIFAERVKPYLQTFAAIDQGSASLDRRQNANAQSQSAFIIRDEGHQISTSDFIVWGIRVFKVVTSYPHPGLNPYLEITANPYGTVEDCDFTLDNTLPTTQPGDSQAEEAVNPFWSDEE